MKSIKLFLSKLIESTIIHITLFDFRFGNSFGRGGFGGGFGGQRGGFGGQRGGFGGFRRGGYY